MKTAIVTGAAGFIGRALTERLMRENVRVYSIDFEKNLDRIPKDPNVTPLSVDLKDSKQLINILRIVNADVFYHLAWNGVSSDVKNDLSIQTSNLPVCLNVLDACAVAGCKHVIIPGSASEYAYCGSVIDGKNPPAPGDTYAATKAAIQVLCQWRAKQLGLNLNWLLIGSIYGPGRNDSNVLTYTIKAMLHGEKTLYTKLEQLWDYLYIDDLIEALYLIGLYGKSSAVYPIGSGEAKPLAEYIRQVQQSINPKAELGIGKLPYKFGSVPDNSVLDIRQLKLDTGFVPQVSFAEGIQRTVAYFRETEDIR